MTNTNKLNSKQYDLEERTYELANKVRNFVKKLPKTIANIEDSKQIVRSSGSQAANYIEANESLSKKDFVMRIKICKKESKETRLWLKLIDTQNNTNLDKEKAILVDETTQLMKIFGAILEKSI